MSQARRNHQRPAFLIHEAKFFRRQGPIGRPPDTPIVIGPTTTPGAQSTNANAPSDTTTFPTVPAPSDTTVSRTTVTTVISPSSTSARTSVSPVSTPSSTSTTSTKTTSTVTTSTTSTSSTSSSLPISIPTISPILPSTGGKTNTVFQTAFSPTSAFPSSTATDASASSGDNSSSGISTAGIIGIAAAGVVGIAVVTGLIMFCIRRLRKGNDSDVGNLRRQSIVLGDESASLRRGNSDGFSARPRPPTMIERHYANIAPSLPNSSFRGIRPGEVMPSVGISPSFPPGARFQQTYYGNTMGQTPLGSPVSIATYGTLHDDHGSLVHSPSGSAASALSRGISIRDPFIDQRRSLQEDFDYTDLNRASVTAFQAAQYAAISRELNIPPPIPTVPSLAAFDEIDFPSDRDAGNAFGPSDKKAEHERDFLGEGDEQQPARASSEFQHSVVANLDDSRIASLPPMYSPQRSANMLSPHEEMNFPVSPSPLNSEFTISSSGSVLPSPVNPAFAGQTPGVGNGSPLRHVVNTSDSKAPPPSSMPSKRPQSTYDDEDAYGGF